MKKILIITGHYGSGKTNLAVNLAINNAESEIKTAAIDIDIVNPYFRTADFISLFKEKNISFYSSMYANTNLDIPAISFDIEAIVCNHDCTIIDVGGDDTGAVVLGRYHDVLKKYSDNIEMIYVINRYRDTGEDINQALELMADIERSSRMKHTKIINNSNLGSMTTPADIVNSITYAEEISERCGLPIMCHTADRLLKCKQLDNFAEYIDIYVKNIF